MSLATDLQWMEVQLEALYSVDARGRLTGRNDPEGGPPPRFFLGRTPHGNLWRFRADLPDAVVRNLARLAAAEPVTNDLEAPPQRLGALREHLEAHGPIEFEYAGPAFRFPETITPPACEVQKLSSEEEPRQPCFGVREAGEVVSRCYVASRGPRAAEAGVDTLEGFRRRGYARCVTAAWASEMRRRGLEPLYSTSWGNRSSREVARSLGVLRYGVDLHFT